MVEIDHTDRGDERRAEQRRIDEKRAHEKKKQHEPMKTFEAKLSEKTEHEMTAKESQLYKLKQEAKKTTDEKNVFADQIIQAATEKASEQDRGKLAALKYQTERHVDQEQESKIRDKRRDAKLEMRKKDDELGVEGDKQESGEISSEGHRRVAEKSDQKEGGEQGQGFSGSFENSGEGEDQGQNQYSQSKQSSSSHKTTLHADFARFVQQGSGLTGGFQRQARDFTRENLDEIVKQVEFGINDFGDAEFSVTLTDDYYEGLKIKTTRSPDGVILSFICPNTSVRSTFLKYRHKVYHHLQSRGVPVFRIEVR